MFNELTIIGGKDKDNNKENISTFTIKQSQIYSIVGFTGSGKSQLIQDIEGLSQGDTVSKRRICIDGRFPELSFRYNPRKKVVSHLSQNMNFVLDMNVKDFLKLRIESRFDGNGLNRLYEVIDCANTLAGEPIKENYLLTKLSGGQSRALMIADLAINSNAPIVLIDEIENAGINKLLAMNLLINHKKIVLVVTHDPVLALLGEKRIIMENGGMKQVIATNNGEKQILSYLERISNIYLSAQDDLRNGKILEVDKFNLLKKKEDIFYAS